MCVCVCVCGCVCFCACTNKAVVVNTLGVCACVVFMCAAMHVYVNTVVVLNLSGLKSQARVHRGTDNQIFNPINLSLQ